MPSKDKKVSGYGSGTVDVVMSVDQVAKEAAAISASSPKNSDLEKLTTSESFISIKNLKAGYGKMEILHDFNLFLGKGQSLCLIGPNGAGKSTVLHSIFGFTNIFSGKIFVNGKNLQNYFHRRVVTFFRSDVLFIGNSRLPRLKFHCHDGFESHIHGDNKTLNRR